MKNKTVLITGSTSGIGLAIAKAFAAQGYNIVFNGLEADGATIAKSVADAAGVDYIFSPANMLDPAAIRALAAEALAKFGTVEVLINNAGIQFVSPLEDFPEAKWDAIIGINLSAAFHLTKAIWPSMKANKHGRVINIASAHGLVASEFKSAYVSAKHGLIGFTKTIALEGAPFGITANSICPGYVHTPIVDKQIPEQMKVHNMTQEEVVAKVFLDKQAIKKFNTVESIAQSALFLASEAAETITGIALPVDGGWTAQ
ncbi:MAG: 3-hydroxybutyrate dehydrogenase [Bacteroidetes bacterium]|nr:3-hydroxybutyrate dehydrogenase [Bacteroidota bacterium]